MFLSLNKIHISILIIICMGAIVLGVNFFSREKIKNIDSKGTDIVAIGDSLVYGYGASESSKNFISLLSGRIGKSIINLGVSGNTSGDVLDRINELDKYSPKVVILLVGGNDFLRKVPKETTFQNIEKIVEYIQNRGSAVLLLGIRGGVLSDNFKNGFEEISRNYQTAYVSDVLSGLITNKQYMYDGVHPNDTGYSMIAERVYPELNMFLK